MKRLYTSKSKVLLLLLLAVAGLAKAQTFTEKEHRWENLPMENTAWVHFFRSDYHDSIYYQIGIKDDTVINNINYIKIIDCPNLGFPIEGRCFGGLRQNEEGKCYFMSFENQEAGFGQTALMAEEGVEYLIYDFSLSECDSFPYNGEEYLSDHPEVIFQIDEAEINGSMRKVFWFDDDCEGEEHYYDHGWIEGIGSNFGLLHSLQLLPTL